MLISEKLVNAVLKKSSVPVVNRVTRVPAINDPTIPTMMFKTHPCWSSVFRRILATQPAIPPTIIHPNSANIEHK